MAVTLVASDAEGDALTFRIASAPAHGTASVNGDVATYTPAANWNGTDTFTFVARDRALNSDPATVTVTISPVNDAPVATAQSVTVNEDLPASVALTGSDVEGTALTFSITSSPAHGELTGTAPNLTYTPNANWNGSDAFSFRVNDGALDSAPATVAVTVSPVNDAPVATAQSVTLDEDTPASVVLTGSDVEGGTLTFSTTTGPAHGTLSGTAPNLTYTPNPNWSGTDNFTFVAGDGALNSAPAIVTVTVSPVNDAPAATAQSVTIDEDTPAPVVLTGSDVEGSALTYSISTGPAHGALTGTAPSLVYTPNANWNGSDAFSFRVNDGALDSAPATVSVTVRPVIDLTQISVTPGNPSVAMGRTVQLAARAFYDNGTNIDVTGTVGWSSSNTGVAQVTGGLVTPISVGSATITATDAASGVSGNTVVAVGPPELTSLVVSPDPATVQRGKKAALTATGSFSDSSSRPVTSEVTWSSSSEAIATVSNASGTEGVVTGVALGAATLRATDSLTGVWDEATVTVTPNWDGTWTGTTSPQNRPIVLTVAQNKIVKLEIGWQISSCSTYGTTTITLSTPIAADGTFSIVTYGSPISINMTGAFAGESSVSGNATISYSSGCTGSTSVTWYATRTQLCGNLIVEPQEECDGTPGCDDSCQRIPVCGDGWVDAPETCDDQNLTPGDGCSAQCQIDATIAESEPNDDGSVASSSNDFSAANADGPFTWDAFISAAITPAGDDDVFAVTNTAATSASVRFETFGPAGPGTCPSSVDTRMWIRDAAGTQLAYAADGGILWCSKIIYTIPANTTVYVHIQNWADAFAIAAYTLQIDFLPQ